MSRDRKGRFKPCRRCGVPFWVKPYEDEGGTRKHVKIYCGRVCMQAVRPFTPEKAEAAFWAKVEKTDRCWLWKGAKRWDGYGRLNVRKKAFTAHRYSYELVHGPVPEGFGVLHSCDTPACVNPAHLSVGTHTENMRDAVAKGRKARGESTGRNKLTEAQVWEIRTTFVPGAHKYVSAGRLARKYGVAVNTILNAAEGKTWKYLNATDTTGASK